MPLVSITTRWKSGISPRSRSITMRRSATLQIGAGNAAQAAIAEQHGLVGALAHQRVVDAGGAEFVDHHRGALRPPASPGSA